MGRILAVDDELDMLSLPGLDRLELLALAKPRDADALVSCQLIAISSQLIQHENTATRENEISFVGASRRLAPTVGLPRKQPQEFLKRNIWHN